MTVSEHPTWSDYHYVTEYSQEDHQWRAWVQEVPTLLEYGYSSSQVMARIREAMKKYLAQNPPPTVYE